MTERARPYVRWLWAGAILFAAGIALDLRWHATHDEFEGTLQQFEAHWLLWIGFLIVLVATVLAFTRLSSAERHAGFTVVLAAGAVYLPVTVWHFVAHANGTDPSLAHVVLAIGDATIIAGVAWSFVDWLRGRVRSRAPA